MIVCRCSRGGAAGDDALSAHLLRLPHAARARSGVAPASQPPSGEHPRPPRRNRSDDRQRPGAPHGRHGGDDVARDRSSRAQGLRRARARQRGSAPRPRAADVGGRAHSRGHFGARSAARRGLARAPDRRRARGGDPRAGAPGVSRAQRCRRPRPTRRRSSRHEMDLSSRVAMRRSRRARGARWVALAAIASRLA